MLHPVYERGFGGYTFTKQQVNKIKALLDDAIDIQDGLTTVEEPEYVAFLVNNGG